jgi:hypothetical protein
MNSEKNADSRSKAQKVLQKSEQQGRNEYQIAYDEKNPFRFYFIFINLISEIPNCGSHFI